MAKMNLPEFTAEASLYKTSEQYQMSQISREFRSKGTLVAQLRVGLNPGSRIGGGINPGDRFCICPCCLCVWTGFGIECTCC